MINIITHVHSVDQIKTLKEMGCYELSVTTPFFSMGIEHTSTMLEIKSYFEIAKKVNIRLGILINRLIMESEWLLFEAEIHDIYKFNPDFYIVSDLGVMLYIKQTTKKPVYFHSETTIANTNDAKLLLQYAESIMPARELTIKKKSEIIRALKEKVMVPVFGYQVISKSYRPLLTNYFNEIQNPEKVKMKKHFFREEKRDNLYIGFEDDHGFTMFTDKALNIFKEKHFLEEAGLKTGWIDSNFIDNEVLYDVVMYFHDLISYQQLEEKMLQWKIETDELLSYQDTTTIKEGSE